MTASYPSACSGSQLGGSFAPQRMSGKSGDIFGCHHGYCGEGAVGIYWVEAKDAGDCPTVHRTAL